MQYSPKGVWWYAKLIAHINFNVIKADISRGAIPSL
jgi:hypothetical protein